MSNFNLINQYQDENGTKCDKIILSILRQENEQSKIIWAQIDKDMKKSLSLLAEELSLNQVRTKTLQLFWWYISRLMNKFSKNGKNLFEIENKINNIINGFIANRDLIQPYLISRSKRSLNQINDYLIGNSIIDIGCGDGLLLQSILSKQMSPNLYDVLGIDTVDYRDSRAKMVPFLKNVDNESFMLPDEVTDNTLLWTVLHHSDNPEYLFSEAVRITKHNGRIIVVEGYSNDPYIYQVNCFFDWFFNRLGKSENINIPLNYKKIEDWHKLFADYHCKLLHQEYLGIDEPVIPEHHILFVLEVE